MSNLLLISSTVSPLWTPKFVPKNTGKLNNGRMPRRVSIKAFFFNPLDEPILKEAVKANPDSRRILVVKFQSPPNWRCGGLAYVDREPEPIAFMGGIFAGLLRLDLNEEPLKDWINRTVEASGITPEEIDSEGANTEEEAPQQIDIE